MIDFIIMTLPIWFFVGYWSFTVTSTIMADDLRRYGANNPEIEGVLRAIVILCHTLLGPLGFAVLALCYFSFCDRDPKRANRW